MNSTNPNRQSTDNRQPTDEMAKVVQFPRHVLTDWSRYQPVTLDPKDRPKLLENGYEPVPLIGKAPHVPGWNNYKDENTGDELKTEITESWLAEKLALHKDHKGTGIRCGHVSCIDIDIKNNDDLCSDVAHCIEAVFGKGLLARRGSKGFAVPLYTPEPFTKRVLEFTDKNGKDHAIEILADGQQFGAFGHVDAEEGKHDAFDYAWFDGESPLTNHAELALPTATAEDLSRAGRVCLNSFA